MARRCFHADFFFRFSFLSWCLPLHSPSLPLSLNHIPFCLHFIFSWIIYMFTTRTLSPAQLLIASRGSRGHMDLEGHKSVESVVRPHKRGLFIQKKFFLFFFDCLYTRPALCLGLRMCSHTLANQEIVRRNKNMTENQNTTTLRKIIILNNNTNNNNNKRNPTTTENKFMSNLIKA